MRTPFEAAEAKWRNLAPHNPTQTDLRRFRIDVSKGIPPLDTQIPNRLEKLQARLDAGIDYHD